MTVIHTKEMEALKKQVITQYVCECCGEIFMSDIPWHEESCFKAKAEREALNKKFAEGMPAGELIDYDTLEATYQPFKCCQPYEESKNRHMGIAKAVHIGDKITNDDGLPRLGYEEVIGITPGGNFIVNNTWDREYRWYHLTDRIPKSE
jgi:hypothetical protein